MSSSCKDNSSRSSFDPGGFFALASWLYDTKTAAPSSCLVQTIISRAYYAALISARDFTNSSTTGPGGHRNVVAALRQIDAYAASKLEALRVKRGKADYSVNEEPSVRDAQISLLESRAVLYASKGTVPSGKPYTTDYLDSSSFVGSTE